MKPSVEPKAIFKNPVLELLTWTSFPVHLIWYGLIILSFFLLGLWIVALNLWNALLLFASGFLMWTLLEYLMHRYIFHFVNDNKSIQRFHFIFHGIHHDNPTEEKRTMMPPIPGLLIGGLYLGFFYLIFGNLSFFITSGIIAGYLLYSSIHYSIHMFKAPRGLEPLWAHHLIHHYQDDSCAYGVSSRFWDRVFGTMPKK